MGLRLWKRKTRDPHLPGVSRVAYYIDVSDISQWNLMTFAEVPRTGPRDSYATFSNLEAKSAKRFSDADLFQEIHQPGGLNLNRCLPANPFSSVLTHFPAKIGAVQQFS